jgi:hypothetical protein
MCKLIGFTKADYTPVYANPFSEALPQHPDPGDALGYDHGHDCQQTEGPSSSD